MLRRLHFAKVWPAASEAHHKSACLSVYAAAASKDLWSCVCGCRRRIWGQSDIVIAVTSPFEYQQSDWLECIDWECEWATSDIYDHPSAHISLMLWQRPEMDWDCSLNCLDFIIYYYYLLFNTIFIITIFLWHQICVLHFFGVYRP